jgi:hypothetical protein
MTRGRRGSLALRRRALPSPPPCRFIPALSQDRAPAFRPDHAKLARPTTRDLPNHRQPHHQHHHNHRTNRPLRTRPQPLPHKNQTHRPAEELDTDNSAPVPWRLELHHHATDRIACFIPAPYPNLAETSLPSDGRDKWRAPASVDSHRSGMMVYEEKNRSGIDTPEVHRRV